MAQVDCKVNLVVLGYVYDLLLVLHVHCYELVADLGSMLSVVHQAELLVRDVRFHFGIVLQFYLLTLDFLAPAVLIEALSEEDNVSKHNLVVSLVDSVAHSVQV